MVNIDSAPNAKRAKVSKSRYGTFSLLFVLRIEQAIAPEPRVSVSAFANLLAHAFAGRCPAMIPEVKGYPGQGVLLRNRRGGKR